MRVIDGIAFARSSLQGYRLRSALTLVAVAIGVAAVVVLTSLGEAARRYVAGQFASLGTHLLIVLPGRADTAGAAPSLLVGETTRDLTIADAVALARSPAVRRVAPISVGSAPVGWSGREREVAVIGSTAALQAVRHWRLARGRFLPPGDPQRARPVCVLGSKLRDELFGPHSALGAWVRIGQHRFRVVGILAASGRSLGMDVDDIAVVPVASAQMLFNTPSLIRILVEARSRAALPRAAAQVRSLIAARHQGEDDVTVVTQDALLATFDRILHTLSLTVTGIAAVSLVVAGILIMNVMLVVVSQRTAEIGLLKALGAPRRQILALFLAEATLVSVLGALLGLAAGHGGSWLLGTLYPVLPTGAPWWSSLAALAVALATGLLFGVLPARRAARLDPVAALARR